MSRDSNGNYSLAALNPVAANTVITPTWANNTMNDIATALTDSLSRSGAGKMLAPLGCVSGTINLPGMTFLDELNTGLYRAASNDIRLSIAGVDRVRATPTAITLTAATTTLSGNLAAVAGTFSGQVSAGSGTISLPALSFLDELNTGLYRAASNDIRLSIAGVDRVRATPTAITLTAATTTLTGNLAAVAGTFTGAVSTTSATGIEATTGPVKSIGGWFGNTAGSRGVSCFENLSSAIIMGATKAAPQVSAVPLIMQGTTLAVQSTTGVLTLAGATSLTATAGAGNVEIDSTFGSVTLNTSSVTRLQVTGDRVLLPNLSNLTTGAQWSLYRDANGFVKIKLT